MPSVRARLVILHAVFLLSGFTAIIYQLIWQRALLTLYGANSETVTVVVAAFMLGWAPAVWPGGNCRSAAAGRFRRCLRRWNSGSRCAARCRCRCLPRWAAGR